MLRPTFTLGYSLIVTLWSIKGGLCWKPYATLLEGNLHYSGQDKVLVHYLDLNEVSTILTKLHKGVEGGYFFLEITIKKIIDACY
jgi:hypothetical protein